MTNKRVRCPVCGGWAEAGCVYGADRGWTGLRWRAGDPSFWSNVVTAWGGGQKVGNHGILRGPYAQGIRCQQCKKIVLDY